jgi:hypothetical protein
MYRLWKSNARASLTAIALVTALTAASLACQAVMGPEPTPAPTPEFSPAQPTTTPQSGAEVPTVESAPAATPTATTAAMATSTSTQPTTAPPTETPTETPAVQPTSPPPPTATPEPAAELAILSFTVDVEDLAVGKRLTFNWQTTGAVRAMIWSGTAHRFPPAWEVSPNGTHVAELTTTYYSNPMMTLVAYDSADNQVSQAVQVEWPCTYTYFFETSFTACPLYEASNTWAAEQAFEHGRMIWLEEISGEDFVLQKVLLVFFADGKYAQFQDTWTEGEPENDPSLTPPDGKYQPIRGFGKVWRENESVRNGLGWALAPEQGFDTTWQQQMRESIPSVAFVRTIDGLIIQIDGWGWETGGNWKFLTQ